MKKRFHKKLSSLPNWKKTKLFIISGREDFFNGGIFFMEQEQREYKKLGLTPPLYSFYGSYMPGKGYTVDPLADSMDEMLQRMIIW